MQTAVATVPQSQGDGNLIYALLTTVFIQPDFNPRTFFEDEAFEELKASVKQQGVSQPVMLRPRTGYPGTYWIVAGERRYRAAKAAGLEEIPAIVRHLSDDEAFQHAVIENTIRANMSPIDEAEAARRVLDACGGDREEARRHLGWSRSLFEARLLLLHATPSVRQAVLEKKVKLQIAELICGLPANTQDGTLAKVIADNMSVQDVKSRISAWAYALNTAVFDLGGCQGCAHNSSQQASLFEENIGDGKCQNHECFHQKTISHLQLRREEYKENFPNVWLDVEKAPDSYTVVYKQGDKGVGNEQFSACRQCGHFGAILSTARGSEGKVSVEDVCSNLPCHKQKIATYATVAKAAISKPEKTGGKTEIISAGTKSSGAKTDKPKTTATNLVDPKAVTNEVERFLRRTAAALAAEHDRIGAAYRTYALLQDADFPTEIMKVYSLRGDKQREALTTQLYALTPEQTESLNQQLVDHLARSEGNHYSAEFTRTAVALINTTKTELAGRFVLDEDFLKAHTKAGIEALMQEAGFDAWYCAESKNPAAFKKLMNSRTDEIIKTILQSKFDFSRFVPKCVRKRLTQKGSL